MSIDNIVVFPGRLLIERELIPQGVILNPQHVLGRNTRRRNKGKVLKAGRGSIFKKGDDVFFLARRGTIIGDNALIEERDIILKNMELLGDRILVQPVEEKRVTEAGIHVPDTVHVEPQVGTVCAVGKESAKKENGEYKVKEGDKILFEQGAGMKFTHEGIVMVILNVTKDLIAIL